MPGAFLDVNQRACEMLGYTRDELLNLTVTDISPPEEWEYAGKIIKELMQKSKILFESMQVRKDGAVFPVEVSANLFKEGERRVVLSHCRDITERKEFENRIRILLKETHHRVKNNMNTVYGLLYMQADELDDPESRSIIKNAALRVQSMMLLYDKIYQSESINELNIKEYLPPLIDEITGIFDSRVPVNTEINVEDIVLNAKTISAVGIILNELITNSMKYAFGSVSEGLIHLEVTRKGNEVTVFYYDNGPGLPESFSFDDSAGFGMQLVNMLVQQLKGTIKTEKGESARFIIRFGI